MVLKCCLSKRQRRGENATDTSLREALRSLKTWRSLGNPGENMGKTIGKGEKMWGNPDLWKVSFAGKIIEVVDFPAKKLMTGG